MDKRRLFLLITALLTLYGCTSTGQGDQQREFAQVRTDTEIQYEANRALVGLKPISSRSHIVVTVFNRVVLLTGQTPKVQWRQQAVSTVQGIPRVRMVHNEIEIAPPASLPMLSRDAYLTSSIKTALLRADELPGGAIKVVTENGVVYLLGLVTAAQARATSDLVRRIKGVRKVVLLFEETR